MQNIREAIALCLETRELEGRLLPAEYVNMNLLISQ
jgi:predicted RNase H-like HicB family nuclease